MIENIQNIVFCHRIKSWFEEVCQTGGERGGALGEDDLAVLALGREEERGAEARLQHGQQHRYRGLGPSTTEKGGNLLFVYVSYALGEPNKNVQLSSSTVPYRSCAAL